MPARPNTIDEYLNRVSDDKRAALEKLRKAIKAAVPSAEESISYGKPAFRLHGKTFVCFGAAAEHCAFYPMSDSTVKAHKDDLQNFDTSKGTVRFQPGKPLPAALVRKLVKARVEENEGRAKKKTKAADAGAQTARKPAAGKSRQGVEPGARLAAPGHQTDPAVDLFMQELTHPLKPAIESLRRVIHGASPAIREGVKWNAPSFRTTDYFATMNLRENRVWLIMHTGAKVKASATKGLKIADPAGLLKWLSKDRCVVTFVDEKDIRSKRPALEAIVREWIKHL